MWKPLIFLSLVVLLSSGVQAEDCELLGFDLGTLKEASYWAAKIEENKHCILPLNYNESDIVSCNLYFSICRPLSDVCPGIESSTCQEVITSDGNSTYFDMGAYESNEDFDPLNNTVGFMIYRKSMENITSKECNSIVFSSIRFVCADDADWNWKSHDVSAHLNYAKHFLNLPCLYEIEFAYSGACYTAPTLSPGHCSLDNYDTSTLKKREYWTATVDSSACFSNFSSSCVMYLSFCHPIPPEIGHTCYGSSVCQIGTNSSKSTRELSMGTYANFTRFHENEESGENGGFNMVVENGSKPDGGSTCPKGLKTKVILTCDESKAWNNQDISKYVEVAYHHDNEQCSYIMTIGYKGACISEGPIIGSSKQSPFGWIIIGLLAFAIIIYLAVGVAYNRFVKGARGVQLLPHYNFWSKMMIFVLEGCKYFLDLITCFKFEGRLTQTHSRQPDYDKI